MYLYVELWKPKEAWLKLSTSERQAKIDQLLQEARQHPITGVIPFSFKQVGDAFLLDGVTEQPIVIDEAVARPTGFRWASAYMIPTKDLIRKFEQRVENLGWWFEYFDQKNAWGEMNVLATVGDMIGAPLSPPSEEPAPAGAGRFGRAEHTVYRLRDDLNDLKKRIDLVVDYVRSEQAKKP